MVWPPDIVVFPRGQEMENKFVRSAATEESFTEKKVDLGNIALVDILEQSWNIFAFENWHVSFFYVDAAGAIF